MQRNKSRFCPELSFALVCVSFALMLSSGCSKTDETLQEHFARTQADTETPDGKVVPSTVTVDGDYVHYQTEHGGRWRTKATKEPDGYSYSDAERVEPTDLQLPDS